MALEKNEPNIHSVSVKFVDVDQPKEIAFPPSFAGCPRPFMDTFEIGPVELRAIEWIKFPVDISETILLIGKQFEVEVLEDGSVITGYRTLVIRHQSKRNSEHLYWAHSRRERLLICHLLPQVIATLRWLFCIDQSCLAAAKCAPRTPPLPSSRLFRPANSQPCPLGYLCLLTTDQVSCFGHSQFYSA